MKPIAEFVGQKLWIYINGKTFLYEPKSQKRKKGALSSEEKNILAPMPGKITALMVQNGDSVKKDQVVVVMEAMKMEYTLKSALDSVITEIRCAVGQQVNAGDTLVCLK